MAVVVESFLSVPALV